MAVLTISDITQNSKIIVFLILKSTLILNNDITDAIYAGSLCRVACGWN